MSTLYRTQVLLETEQHEKLKKIAQNKGQSVSEIIRELLRDYLAEQELVAAKQREMQALAELSVLRSRIAEQHGFYQEDMLSEIRNEREHEIGQAWQQESKIVVIDANIILALFLPLPFSELATDFVKGCKQQGITISAPVLSEYEAVSALRRAISLAHLSLEEAFSALDSLSALGIQYHISTSELNVRSLEWAGFLNQSKAYDAQYLALAEQLQAKFWTADRRLVNSAVKLGANWVNWLEENQKPEIT